jgi:hypothetical protein
MEFRKIIFYKNWKMVIQPDGQLEVTTAGETRVYNIPEPIKSVEYEGDEYVIINVIDPEIKRYQYKFEFEDFLVGDTFDDNDEFIDSFACHVYGESC